MELTTPPLGPQDVLRRVLSSGAHGAGLLLACTQGQPALLVRFGPGDDAATLLAATKLGAGLLDVLVVQHGRWRSLMCRDAACCPAEGRLLPESSPTGRFNP
jgi:hypothetical protein